VVCVGASAGGLEAIEALFETMPLDTGMAFVVVQHLSPDFKSHMEELLARKTRIPIPWSRTACWSRPTGST
jgi:two-component system CheB/CheR fusion protein